jgi:transcriptional regulator GlxA family with amidase domain
MPQVAVVTFDGFNELDSFIASAIINRCRKDGLEAFITTPTPVVTSMNGVEVTGQRPMSFVAEADVVLIGSGVQAREIAADDEMLARLVLDPSRQLIGSQCSGALVLAAHGTLGEDAARAVIDYVAPYGENEETVERAMRAISETPAVVAGP